MNDLAQARQALAIAQLTSKRLWAELNAYWNTLDPARGVDGEEKLRRMREASEWQSKVYSAEQALYRAEPRKGRGLVDRRGRKGLLKALHEAHPSIGTIGGSLIVR